MSETTGKNFLLTCEARFCIQSGDKQSETIGSEITERTNSIQVTDVASDDTNQTAQLDPNPNPDRNPNSNTNQVLCFLAESTDPPYLPTVTIEIKATIGTNASAGILREEKERKKQLSDPSPCTQTDTNDETEDADNQAPPSETHMNHNGSDLEDTQDEASTEPRAETPTTRNRNNMFRKRKRISIFDDSSDSSSNNTSEEEFIDSQAEEEF